jgi:hypothetical protein
MIKDGGCGWGGGGERKKAKHYGIFTADTHFTRRRCPSSSISPFPSFIPRRARSLSLSLSIPLSRPLTRSYSAARADKCQSQSSTGCTFCHSIAARVARNASRDFAVSSQPSQVDGIALFYESPASKLSKAFYAN